MSSKASQTKVPPTDNTEVHEISSLIHEANVRLCRLRLWLNRQGIGFQISPSSSSPPIIRMVESNSPASAVGLQICDAILAINNQNVSEANFQQVTASIKTALDTKGGVDLLVVQQKFYKELRKKDISMISSLANVLVTPATMPADFLNFPKHQPRTCDIHLNKDNKTFGFEVVSGDDDIGMYIQEVTPNSPASDAGLRKSDRIIEINGTYIEQDSNDFENHGCVQRNKDKIVSKKSNDGMAYESYDGKKTDIPVTIQHNHRGQYEFQSYDINQNVDAIVVSTASTCLTDNILARAGQSIKQEYLRKRNRSSGQSIRVNGGHLNCKRIYFIPCSEISRNADKWIFRNFVSEAFTLANNDIETTIQSIAFPTIGCGKYRCSPTFIAKTLIMAVAYQLEKNPSLQLDIYFVIQSHQQNVFDAFQNELMTLKNNQLPSKTNRLITIPKHIPFEPRKCHQNKDFVIEKRLLDDSDTKYTAVVNEFWKVMAQNLCTRIVRVELVWNERWYQQYMIHKAEFSERLQRDTEKRLFHGCPETAANNIITEGFNRGYAGRHGKHFGCGVYFSSNPSYSHSFTVPNSKGQRCMFLARVLIGNTILGNSSMKTCPSGSDTTTDGDHIYVTYHDAQAFGEYLITYE
ncbi:unnamed protein product [Rotaria sp. Silwood1]|nr:unnamed protein product [Rotaria sp. Silwood1]